MANREREVRDDWSEQVPWQRFERRDIIEPEGLRSAGSRGDWNQPGPHTGKGPRNYRRSDERIREEVCERMSQNGRLDASEISVEVKGGEVTLTGNVADRRSKRLAEDIADSVSGMRDVHNELRRQDRKSVPERWTDRVGETGVHPVSADTAPPEAEAHGMASWGQGERGAEGYYDHGESELRIGRQEGTES